ncbi:unnamed protein product [Ambrosiozyma monospora]|uniref:Unnamed protein product n=1 Tax=Ambrosiozyma monospora TaxID=43982 RepID=A0ACB5T859_AMBMO|nr:unnamed protein product [Ambrosiozyma monospora]
MPAAENEPLLPQSIRRAPTVSQNTVKTIKLTLKSSPINWFLLFVPFGILAEKLSWGSTAIFTLNFLAIIPLASVLAFATEELGESLHNNSIAGLMNATFGNAVEVIVSIIALKQNQITMVQASMLDSRLNYLTKPWLKL